MGNVQHDLMYDAIARMKYGMTVAEAKDKSICIKCKAVVSFMNDDYESLAFCRDCSERAQAY